MTGKRSPEEFDAWQLAWELKRQIVAFTAIAPAVHDRKFCDEINKAARSAPDNIAEGFYRFNPVDFANFVRIARGSLGEVRNQVKHARDKGYLTDSEFAELFHLCRRAIGAATGLRLYLLSCPNNFDRRKSKPNSAAVGERRAQPKPPQPPNAGPSAPKWVKPEP
jgi:four helix bundle protein